MDNGSSGIHPVEQMVDAAIDRLAREKRGTDRDKTPHVLDTTPRVQRDTTPQGAIVPHAGQQAIVRAVDIRRPGRLRWKGLDVSAEFREYAERVARGEDLPPFEGRILAEPSSKFPWDQGALRKGARRGTRQQVVLWSSAALVSGLLAWTVAVRLTTPPAPAFTAPEKASTAIMANRNTPAPARAIGASTTASTSLEEGKQSTETAASTALARHEEAAVPVREEVRGPAPSATPPPAPRPAPVASAAPAPAPVQLRQTPPAPAQEPERSVPVDIAAPGALREALGALLSARAASGAAPGASPATPGAPSDATTSTPPGAAAPGAAGKEPSGESSAKGSLLVETPSF